MSIKKQFVICMVFLGLIILGCATWGLEKVLVCPYNDLNICQLDQARCGAIATLQTVDKYKTEVEFTKAFDKAMRACLKSANWKVKGGDK